MNHQVDHSLEHCDSGSFWKRIGCRFRDRPVWTADTCDCAVARRPFPGFGVLLRAGDLDAGCEWLFAQARLIADEGRTDIVVESPSQYVGDHWMRVGEGHYYGQYPPGLPALLALVYRPLGPWASLWVIPLMGTLSLLALFLVVRDWLGPGWGLVAAALMAVNPFANAHALGADSHTAVCFFLMWGLLGYLRWEHMRSAWWAALAGFCLGMIPTIRYAEALFPVAVAVFVARGWRREDGNPALAAGVVCGALPMLALALRNQSAFGAFLAHRLQHFGRADRFRSRLFSSVFPSISLLDGDDRRVRGVLRRRGAGCSSSAGIPTPIPDGEDTCSSCSRCRLHSCICRIIGIPIIIRCDFCCRRSSCTPSRRSICCKSDPRQTRTARPQADETSAGLDVRLGRAANRPRIASSEAR